MAIGRAERVDSSDVASEQRDLLKPSGILALVDDQGRRHSLIIGEEPITAEQRNGRVLTIIRGAVIKDQPPELLIPEDDSVLKEARAERRSGMRGKVLVLLAGALGGFGTACSGNGSSSSDNASDNAMEQGGLEQARFALEASGLQPQEAEFSHPDNEKASMHSVDVDGETQGLVLTIKADPDSPTGQKELFVLQGDLEALLGGEEEIQQAVKVELPEDVSTGLENADLTGAVYDPATGIIYYSHAGSGAMAEALYNAETQTVSNAIDSDVAGGVPLNITPEDEGQILQVRNADNHIVRVNLNTGAGESTSMSAECGGYAVVDDGEGNKTYLVPNSMFGGECMVTAGATLVEAIGSYSSLINLNLPYGPDGNIVSVEGMNSVTPIIEVGGKIYALMYTGKVGLNGPVAGNFMGVWTPIGEVCGDGECNGDETPEDCSEDCGDPVVEPGPDVVEQAPDVAEPGPDVVEQAPDVAEPGPEVVEPVSEVVEPDTDTADAGLDEVDPPETTPETTPDTTPETTPETTPDTTTTQCVAAVEGILNLGSGGCKVELCPIEGSDGDFNLTVTQADGAECVLNFSIDGELDGEDDATVGISDLDGGGLSVKGKLYDTNGEPHLELEGGLNDLLHVKEDGHGITLKYKGTSTGSTASDFIQVDRGNSILEVGNFDVIRDEEGNITEIGPDVFLEYGSVEDGTLAVLWVQADETMRKYNVYPDGSVEEFIPDKPTCQETDTCVAETDAGGTETENEEVTGGDIEGYDSIGKDENSGGGGGGCNASPSSEPGGAENVALGLLGLGVGYVISRRKHFLERRTQ